MDMEYGDMYRSPYHSMNERSFHPQPQPPQNHGHAQYPFWTPHWVALYQQQQRAAMLGQAHLHGQKQTEPKPRLAKDEVELLEREFAKNQKPISSTKRELAEQMGVDVARINNWFQNRRAKEKHIKKTREFEEQQARERSSSESKSPTDQVTGEAANEATREPALEEPGVDFDEDDDEDSDEPAIPEYTQTQALATAHTVVVDNDTRSHEGSDGSDYVHVGYSSSSPLANHEAAELQSTAHQRGFDTPQVQTSFNTPSAYTFEYNHMPHPNGNTEPGFENLTPQKDMMTDSSVFTPFNASDYFAMPAVPTFPSQMIHNPMPSRLITTTETLQSLETEDDIVKAEHLSPASMSLSPPAPVAPAPVDMRFKSPPPSADIATRRNIRRPAPLGLGTIRSFSHPNGGPKTGIDVPRRTDAATPMRRISSATGSLSGRIQKMGAAPRSPFCLDRNKEALLHNLQQTTRSPVLGALNNGLSPLSPEQHALREATVVSEDDQGYVFGPLGGSLFKVENTIKTPPGTPGLPMSFHQAWNYGPQDEPLPTPSLCSHGGSELEFSMAGQQLPGYVASQPVTPSFTPNIGPAYNFFGNGGLSNAEYTFPESYTDTSARSSPSQSNPKNQFQFAQNVTPHDFNHPTAEK